MRFILSILLVLALRPLQADVWDLVDASQAAYDSGIYSLAQRKALDALTQDASNLDAWYLLARSREERGHFADSLRAWRAYAQLYDSSSVKEGIDSLERRWQRQNKDADLSRGHLSQESIEAKLLAQAKEIQHKAWQPISTPQAQRSPVAIVQATVLETVESTIEPTMVPVKISKKKIKIKKAVHKKRKKKNIKKRHKKNINAGDRALAWSPRHRLLGGWGLPNFNSIDDVKDLFRSSTLGQLSWSEGTNFAVEYAYRDFTLSARYTYFGVDQILKNTDPMCMTGCGDFSFFYDFDVIQLAVGYDLVLNRRSRNFQVYLPLQMETSSLGMSTPNFNVSMACSGCKNDLSSLHTGLGLTGGLGFRYYAWRWLVLDASARYYSGELVDLFKQGDTTHFVQVKGGSNQTVAFSRDMLASNAGYDVLFRLGFAIW